jgi:hypothetical protein
MSDEEHQVQQHLPLNHCFPHSIQPFVRRKLNPAPSCSQTAPGAPLPPPPLSFALNCPPCLPLTNCFTRVFSAHVSVSSQPARARRWRVRRRYPRHGLERVRADLDASLHITYFIFVALVFCCWVEPQECSAGGRPHVSFQMHYVRASFRRRQEDPSHGSQRLLRRSRSVIPPTPPPPPLLISHCVSIRCQSQLNRFLQAIRRRRGSPPCPRQRQRVQHRPHPQVRRLSSASSPSSSLHLNLFLVSNLHYFALPLHDVVSGM